MNYPFVVEFGSGTVLTAVFFLGYMALGYMCIEKKFTKKIRIIVGALLGIILLLLIPGTEFFYDKLNAFFYSIYY